MRITSLFLTALIVMASLSAGARIRVTGNGGGSAEMAANFAWQRLELFVQPCLQQVSACGLNANEASLVEAASQGMPQERLGEGLVFYIPSPREEATELPFHTDSKVGALVELNAKSLYVSDGVAEPFSRISALVLAAVMSHHSDLSQDALIAIAGKVMNGVSDDESTTAIADDGLPVLHEMTITRAGMASADLLFIEFTQGSADLAPLFVNQIPCAMTSWTVKNVNRESVAKNLAEVSGDLSWICADGTAGSGDLELSLPMADQQKEFITQAHAKIMGVIQGHGA